MTDAIRQRIVEVARAEIGPGRIDAYWRSALGPKAKPPWPKHWCGAFCLFALHEADVATDVLWKIGLGFCEVQRLPKTRLPKPGDIFYADQPFKHHAVVAAVTNSGIDTIDGNQGGPRPVQAKHRAFSDRWIFYSIEPLLRGVVAPDPIPPALKRVELKRGDKSEAVKELQTLMNKAQLGIKALVVDGDFGPKTENAVKAFQASRLLVPNGVCAAATWLELDKLD